MNPRTTSIDHYPGAKDELCAPHMFTFGHVRQLDGIAASPLTELAAQTPLLTGADQVCWVDIDDTIRATHGYANQGAGFGYCGVKGLGALLAILSTPLSPPVLAATRLRAGKTNSAPRRPPAGRGRARDREGLPGRRSGRERLGGAAG